jgi:hypothetical protein
MIKDAIYVCRSTVKLWNTMFHLPAGQAGPGNEVVFIESGIDEFGSETVTIQTEENKIVCSKFLFSTNFILLTKPACRR